MNKLYKLKSNPQTIVKKTDNHHQVVWAESMFSCYDARWMVSRWNPDNVIELTPEETEEVNKNLSVFLGRKVDRY